MRHASDALMTGIGTVLVDDPFLTDRTEMPRGRKLLRVILDSQLRLPLRSNLVRTADGDVLVFTRVKENSPKTRALRRAGVEVVRLTRRGSQPDLAEAIEELGRRNILSVLLEAGSTLNSAAVAAGIVDKVRVYVAPKIAGSVGKSPRAGAASARIQSAKELLDVTIEPSGPDFAIEGYLRDVYRNR
jgi:diaminohydroxyphosphoribosylaminopyrimidine deaminase/5-amino-6-(5-phosphoribosylamino)uracil reductase